LADGRPFSTNAQAVTGILDICPTDYGIVFR